MDRDASAIFNNLFNAGQTAFKHLRNNAFSPETKKHLRTWGITEASEMIGRSSQTLRALEQTGKIEKARQIKKGKRSDRYYSLADINKLRDFFNTRPHKPNNSVPAILGFVNFKGGAGKTTTAITAAQYFTKKGYKVLFVDCDSQGSATQMFGHIPDEDFGEEDTLLNILTNESSDIKKIINPTHWDGLDLIPANLGLYNAELMIPIQIANKNASGGEPSDFFNRLNMGLRQVYNDYDIIVLDCPPSMGMISINAIVAANALLIEMPPVIVDFASTVQFFKMVSEVLERLPIQKKYSFIRVLLTKYNGRTSASDLKNLLKEFFGQYIMSNVMIESEAISRSASNMQTLYEVDRFIGGKQTFIRAIEQANRVNGEIEDLIKLMWGKQKEVVSNQILVEEVNQ